MLTLDLARLWREGTVEAPISIDPDDGFWADMELRPTAPLVGEYRATRTATGDVLVTGRFTGEVDGECRRCLRSTMSELGEEFRLVFSSEPELVGEGGDGTFRPLDPGMTRLELREPLREEVLLSVPTYVLCDEACRGLCPLCGGNRNEEECDCAQSEEDPRWAPLRALKHP